MHSQSDVDVIIFWSLEQTCALESYNLSQFIDEIVNFISYFSIPRDVADHLFQYLTDTHVRRLIIANGWAGGQLFDNMRASNLQIYRKTYTHLSRKNESESRGIYCLFAFNRLQKQRLFTFFSLSSFDIVWFKGESKFDFFKIEKPYNT